MKISSSSSSKSSCAQLFGGTSTGVGPLRILFIVGVGILMTILITNRPETGSEMIMYTTTTNTLIDSRTNKKYTLFFGQKMCHPGYGPHNSCTERLAPSNPFYTADCPNLDIKKNGDNTLWPLGDPRDEKSDDNSTSSSSFSITEVGGRHGCDPSLDTWNNPFICAYLCYSHQDYGVTVIPKTIWHAAQEQEGAVWKKLGGNNDRAGEHITAFHKYQDVTNRQLGDVIEVGSGPWTQSRFLFKTVPEVISTVKSFTVYEPGAEFYIDNVRTCAYKDRTALQIPNSPTRDVYKFPLHIIGTGGESLLDHPTQYDTLVSINVIEHVQNAYSYLTGLHRALKPGGLLIYHDRFFDDPNEGNCVLGVNHYHPIRITRMVLDMFLDQFEEIFRSTEPTSRMVKSGCNEKPVYFIGIKK
mmetsp:Transcript_21399/g.50876  ORF Transcript_21399/g.50876 Transcript_21399/m.50876 type:complete len:413 (-) Transcript_21399:165-1403(-)